MRPFKHLEPKSVEKAAESKAKLKAAGTDLLDLMKSHIETPEEVANLLGIPGLRGVEGFKGGTRIGALTTLAEIGEHKGLREIAGALAEACAEAATPQVRNVATIGGNVCQRPRCWYFRSPEFDCLKKGGKKCYAIEGENRYHAIFETEPCPIVHASNAATALLALDGKLAVQGPEGHRELSMGEFLVTPSKDIRRENVLGRGDVITHVVLPREWPKSLYREFRQKESFDWALVNCAAAADMKGRTPSQIRLVLGAVAPVPRRLEEVEKLVAGKGITEKLAAEAGELAVKGAKPLSQNKYKVQMARVIVKRSLLALAGSE